VDSRDRPGYDIEQAVQCDWKEFQAWPLVVPEMRMMNGLAGWGAAYVNFRLLRRALVAAVLAQTLSGCFEIINTSMDVPAPQAVSAATRGPCPSQDFPAFLDAFGESVEVQRGYTHIPLAYGQLNAGLIGTRRENEALTTRTINSFDAIPIFDGKDGGRILRSKAKRRERGLKIRVEPDREDDQNTKTATILLPRTGFHLEFQFVSTETCWELVRIDDRSK
jgi:hypothetical protein